MYKKSKKFFRKNKQEFISALSVFSLILNLSFPLVAYAETTTTTTPTTEETETVVEEEAAIDEESTEEESTSEEETTSEESATSEEETTDEEESTTETTEQTIEEETKEESTEEVISEKDTVTTEATEQATTQTQETNISSDELNNDEVNNNEENKKEEESEEDLTGMECLAEDADTSVSADSDWEIDGDVAETKDDVVLGVRYEFPLNHDVSVMFNCLPKDESLRSHLIIEQIDMEDLDLPAEYQTSADYAYDITTEMENGEFEYEITLPNWGDEDSEIAYVEKSGDEVKREGVSKEDMKDVDDEERDGSKVKAKLNHLTLFLIVDGTNVPDNWGDWQNYYDNDGYLVTDYEDDSFGINDSSNGGTNVSPSSIDIASASEYSGTNAGEQSSLQYKYDDLGTATCEDDVLYLRMRLEGNPQASGGSDSAYTSYHWDFLIDTDNNGSSDFVVDIFGGKTNSFDPNEGSQSGSIGLYPNDLGQTTYTSTNVLWTAQADDNVNLYTQVEMEDYDDGDSDNDQYWMEGAVPLNVAANFQTALCDQTDLSGQLFASTSTSNTDPLQKDWMNPVGFFTSHYENKSAENLTDTGATTEENPAEEGDVILYTLVVTNDGTKDIPGFEISDDISDILEYATVSDLDPDSNGNLGVVSSGVISWDPQDIAIGSSISEQFEVTVNSSDEWPTSDLVMTNVYGDTVNVYIQEEGYIQVLKVADPDDSTLFNFDIFDGNGYSDTFSIEGSGSSSVFSLEPGVYSITETVPDSWTLDNVSCDSGTPSSITNGIEDIDVVSGETVTCTFNNSFLRTYITLIKDVSNDNGGQASENQFGLQIGDTYVNSGQTLEVAANTPVAINEDGLAGYDFVSITGDPECPSELGGTVSLDPGQDITCTINNDDIAPTLTLVKEVTNNNGGDADPEDWTLFATDGDSSFNGKSGVSAQVKANEPIILSESSILNGYENEGWECDGGTLVENQITLGLAEDVTCTVTNNDISPQLTVIKIVENNDGGLLNPGNFTINVTGDNVSDPSFPGDNQGTTVTLNAGSYNVTEELIDGYTPQYSEDCDGTIGLGESKTCTITNGDEAPTLTLIKKVENDNGGSRQVSDFQLYIGDIPVESGDSTQLEANVLYTVSEDNLEGYQASDWGGDCSAGGTITLEPGQDAECTITNDDVGPLLKLRKVVINEYDEEVADASEWTLGAIDNDCGTVDEAENCGFTDSGDSTTFHEVLAGEQYTLFETGGPDTYEQGPLGWRCDTSGVRTLNTVSLSPGDQVTCTIINYAIAPTLTITKIVEGGDAEVSDFNLFANRFGFNSGVPQEVNAGTYQVRETTNVEGYTGVFGGDCNEQGIVKVDIAEDKECTITNTRDTGTITILKNIDWDESGEIGDHPNDVLGSEAWTWDISGGEKDIATGSSRELNTDTYTITEDLQDNYHLVGWVCTDQSQGANNSISIDLDKDEDITCTFTNAPDTGLISGYKYNDLDGDGTIEEGEPPYSFWRIELYDDEDNLVDFQLTDVEGYYAFTDLVPGTYHLEEEQLVGYVQTVPGPDQGIGPIEITPGDESTGNIFGNFELITISGYKYNDLNANGERDLEEPGLSGWTINLSGSDTDSDITVESGYFEFTGLGPGTYNLQESQQEGWQQTDGNEGYEVVAQSGQDAVEGILFGNAQLTDIHGYKWLDGNANGIRDCYYPQLEDEIVRTIGDELPEPVCEEFLSGWTIFIDENDNQQLDEGEPNMETDSSEEELGWYWFEDLLPGTYSICEVQQAGWAQTHPTETQCHTITVPGNCFIYDDVSPTVGVSATAQQFPTQNYVFACEYNFGNVPVNPELLISKSNDTGGTDQEIGDLVEYTITVRVEESDVNEVTVTDLLPEGFVYQSGSWTADSDVRGDLKGLGTTPEPTYASPGTWQLGDMEAGETVTLTYIAKIQNSVDEGLYKDLAWANGDDVLENNVTASSESPGVVNDTFVGTEVNVISDDPFTDEAEVEEEEVIEEEVLGAATFLPATGSDTGLLYAGMMILVIGLISLLAGVNMLGKEKTINYLKGTLRPFVITVFLLLAMSSVSHAGSLAVRVEEPEANANSSFAITFVALDQENLEVSAQCYVKKPGAGSFTAFGPVINLGAGGDTDECQVGNSVLTSEGTYVFKVEASTSEETLDSDEVTVDYDGDGPERPKYIEKDRTSSCTYDIKVQTHADGNTSYIEVYADDDKDIEVNAGSRIKTINIGPDEEVEFEHEVYGPDCAETFYFATVAFDSADNPSKVRVEVIEDVVTKTTTIDEGTTQEQGAIPVSDEGGSILGLGDEESTTEEEATTEEDEGQVLGEGDEETDFESDVEDGQTSGFLARVADNWPWLLVVILVLLLGNAIRKRRNRS